MSSAGPWEVTHWKDGHPMWCQLHYRGREILHGIHHKELRDLEHVIKRAILECRDDLPDNCKHEMD